MRPSRNTAHAQWMRYFYSCNQVKRRNFDVQWHPGLECLGDYPSKHHITSHHQNVRPIYLHTKDSLLFLTRAPNPSDLRECVGKTLAGYKRGRPLQVLPRIRPRLLRGTKRVPHDGIPRQTLTSTRAIRLTRGDMPSQ